MNRVTERCDLIQHYADVDIPRMRTFIKGISCTLSGT